MSNACVLTKWLVDASFSNSTVTCVSSHLLLSIICITCRTISTRRALPKKTVQYSLITARRTLNALGLAQVQDQTWFASIFVPHNKFCHLVCHMCHPWLLSHAPSSMSASFSSTTYPTTQREHSHLQAHTVDKSRHQESLWRQDLQSGRNPRTTTPTGSEPKELATVSRIEAYSGDPYQSFDVQENFWRRTSPSSDHRRSEGCWRNWDSRLTDSKILETSCFQSQMHFDESVGSTVDSDLEDGELQQMLTSPLYAQKASVKPDAMESCRRKRGKCTIYSSRSKGRKVWSRSSEGQKALVKPNALFSSEQGNLIKSSVFGNANPSNLRGSLLEGNKDHLLNQSKSDWWRKNCMSNPSISASVNCNDKRQRLALQDAQYWLLNQGENKFDCKKNYLSKKVLRNTPIRNMHEMGEMKRGQELRVDEVSVQKLSENHETIQQLSSQLQEMQQQMNSVSDSGDFQDVESKFCGRLSHVSSQPVMIPSARSMLSRDKRLPHDTWNHSGLQEYVFWKLIFLRLIHPEIILKEFNLTTCKETEKQSLEQKRRILVAQFQWHLQQNRWQSSTIPVELPQNYMVGQQRQRISELQFDNSPIHNRFQYGKFDSKPKSLPVLIFHRILCYGSKTWRWLFHWKNWNPRDQFMERFFQTPRCWTRGLLQPWTRSSRIPSSRRKSVSKNWTPRKRTGFYEEDRSVLHDLRLLSSDWRSWHSTRLCWFLLCCSSYDDNVEEFIHNDTRWDEVHNQCRKFHPMMSWKVCTNGENVSPRNLKPYWNCTTWRFIRKSRCPIITNWRRWWRGVLIRNFDCEILTPDMGDLKEPWSRVERGWVALKDEKESVSRGKKKASVRKETDAVSATKPNIVRKKPEH